MTQELIAEAVVIGNISGKHQLGIGDGWVALRIKKTIEAGKLEVTEHAPYGDFSISRNWEKDSNRQVFP